MFQDRPLILSAEGEAKRKRFYIVSEIYILSYYIIRRRVRTENGWTIRLALYVLCSEKHPREDFTMDSYD